MLAIGGHAHTAPPLPGKVTCLEQSKTRDLGHHRLLWKVSVLPPALARAEAPEETGDDGGGGLGAEGDPLGHFVHPEALVPLNWPITWPAR